MVLKRDGLLEKWKGRKANSFVTLVNRDKEGGRRGEKRGR